MRVSGGRVCSSLGILPLQTANGMRRRVRWFGYPAPALMADSSNPGLHTTSDGSSKLELPTSQRRGSGVTAATPTEQPAIAESEGPITDQPTAISKKPPIGNISTSARATRALTKSLVGTHLMHFHIEEFVGGGGMGAVFRGRDLTLGRTVAIKVLSQEHIDGDMIRRFRHEAESAAKLDHPGIPHVYFLGEQDGWYFIVFEFIEGKNIRDYVAQQGPLSIPQTIVYLADIAEALQHASSRDVVHRDIKPSNVLVTEDDGAKLVDMGLARTEQIQSTADDLTATGVTLGTFDYISPEQAADPRSADTRSDIYSLGCTLYFMLTGKPPFPHGTMLQKVLSHTSESPPDPNEVRSDIPPQLTDLLARMLAKQPEHRFQDATELLGEILLLAQEQNVPINSASQRNIVIERPIVRESGWRRHVPWAVPLAVLVMTSLVLHFWRFEPTPPTPIVDETTTSSPSGESSDGGLPAAPDQPNRQ